MKTFVQISFIFLIYMNSLMGGQKKYQVSEIPEELKENADAVVRNDYMEYEIESVNEITSRIIYAVTILNKNAIRYGAYSINYDKDVKIKYFKGNVYDADGILVKKLKKSYIKDVSAVSNFSLYEDDRVQYATLGYYRYPFTVEFECETSKTNNITHTNWYFQGAERLSVEQSILRVSVPEDLDIRYKEYNVNTTVQVQESDGLITYEWKENNLKAYELEPFSPPRLELIPWLRIAPTRVRYHDYEGDFSNWKTIGDWINHLNNGKDVLPEETVTFLHSHVPDSLSDLEKVKKVYTYLQENTRYVSIQLGIGGFQPFSATKVDQYKYGDCKALSNYMMSMLKALNIQSYYSIINAGNNALYIDTEFPSLQFNHVILYVPLPEDTVWLECTSQTVPFGYLGSFTGNRYALVVKEDGGEMIKTSSYNINDNTQCRHAMIEIDENGNASARVNTVYGGLQYENDNLDYYVNQSHENQKKWLYQKLDLPSFEIKEFSFSQVKHAVPSITESLNLFLNKYAALSGKRIFFKPNVLNCFKNVPREIENRKYEVYHSFSFIDKDTVVYKLPQGYRTEYVPEPVEITSKFGYYRNEIIEGGDEIIYTRVIQMNKGRFPASDYEIFREFYKQIVNADKEKIVLIKDI